MDQIAKQSVSPEAKVVVPLKDLVSDFIKARDKITELTAAMEPYKEAKTYLQQRIIEEFKRRDEFSSRLEGATVTLSVRKTAVVVDEQAVMDDLKSRGLDRYIVESLSPEFEEVKKYIAAGTSEKLAGMEIRGTEFVSVRKNDKADPRKITPGEFVKLGGSHD